MTIEAIQNGTVERSGGLLRTVCMAGAVGLLIVPAIMTLVRRSTKRQELDRHEARVDKNLKETFPASDPPAHHYTDIPVNRQ